MSGDIEALQTGYRKKLGQRLITSIRDSGGKRELFCAGDSYVVIGCCNDAQKLQSIRRRLQSSIGSLDTSVAKLSNRIYFLNCFSSNRKKAREDLEVQTL